MKIILASSNQGKVREFKELFGMEVIPYKEVIGEKEIEENGTTFKENAIIKAKSIFDSLENPAIVISDDSGISVPVLKGEPGIYSARYAKEGASDQENLQKLIHKLKDLGIKKTPAYYTAAIAIATPIGIYTVHGWMWGEVIDEPRGEGGFGYDPIFIPEGYEQTLGELPSSVKSKISHRAKAARLAKVVLQIIRSDIGSAKSL